MSRRPTPPSATGEPYLRLDGVRKTFGKFTALKDVALQIERGELVTFLGPSGCGKTTLLRIIAGLGHRTPGASSRAGATFLHCPR